MTQTNETDVRVGVLTSLITTPHGKLEELAPLHQEAQRSDPLFYGFLACYIHQHSTVRDHKVLVAAHLLTSPYPAHREAGWVLLQGLPVHMVGQAVDYAKRVLHKMPRTFVNAVRFYLQRLEGNRRRFDDVSVRSRDDLIHLYTTLHIKPSETAQKQLFDGQPAEGTKAAIVRQIAHTEDPAEQARLILEHHIPYTTAVGALRSITPAALIALIEVMSPAEILNHMKALEKRGALTNPDTKALIDAKVKRAEKDTRVNTQKVTKAAQAAQAAGDDGMATRLRAVRDTRVKTGKRIQQPTALFIDKSGSMQTAIKVATEHLGPVIAAACDNLYVFTFDTMAYAIPVPEEHTQSAWEKAFAMVIANSGTAIGAPLAKLQRDRVRVDQVIIVSDLGDNNAPYFHTAYAAYAAALGVRPEVMIVGVKGANTLGREPTIDTARVEMWKREGIPVQFWEWGATSDYYSTDNLIGLLAQPSYAELVDEIMAMPMPTKAAFLHDEIWYRTELDVKGRKNAPQPAEA